MECGYRRDLVVEPRLIVEIKSVEQLIRARIARTLTDLKLSGAPAGLLMNVNVPQTRHGIRRLIHIAASPSAANPTRASPPRRGH